MSEQAHRPIEIGQAWRYVAPDGREQSCLIVGAIVRFPERRTVVCCAAIDKRASDHARDMAATPPTAIAFIPMTEAAFRASITHLDSERNEVPDSFFDEFDKWHGDPRGMRVFDVTFEGSLERMIARQMARIAKLPA
jgi:hypothetical protein